jgi:hypothetical protein
MSTETSANIQFVDAPPETHRKSSTRSRWEDRVATDLRARPGEWALVRSGPTFNRVSPYAHFLRQVGVEAYSRRVSDNEIVVYARWPQP